MDIEEQIKDEIMKACDELCLSLTVKISSMLDTGRGDLLYPKQLLAFDGLKKTGKTGLPQTLTHDEFRAYRIAGHFPKPDVDRGRHSRWRLSTYRTWLDDPDRMSIDEFLRERKRKATD